MESSSLEVCVYGVCVVVIDLNYRVNPREERREVLQHIHDIWPRWSTIGIVQEGIAIIRVKHTAQTHTVCSA